MQTDRSVPPTLTHEGAVTVNHLSPIQQLRRTVLTALLFKDTAYESAVSITDRIRTLVASCSVEDVCALAIEARSVHNLRHVPLLLVRELLRRKGGRIVGDTIAQVIQRADELAELVAIYWSDTPRKHMLPKQLRLGLARAFSKFDEYQLSKYSRNENAVKLRDVLFMSHAHPTGDREELYRKLANWQLATADTWEARISSGADKKESFETLIREKKLGALALLRNIRNMTEAGISDERIAAAIDTARFSRTLPWNFLLAYDNTTSPLIGAAINNAMIHGLKDFPTLPGRTLVLVDVSGSMNDPLSSHSEINCLVAASGLAVMLRAVCEFSHIATFSEALVSVPNTEGIALVEAIATSQCHGGTYLGKCLTEAHATIYDRLIVITDEQSTDCIPPALLRNREYIINVALYRNGVGYEGNYVKIDGFSQATIQYITAIEQEQNQ